MKTKSKYGGARQSGLGSKGKVVPRKKSQQSSPSDRQAGDQAITEQRARELSRKC